MILDAAAALALVCDQMKALDWKLDSAALDQLERDCTILRASRRRRRLWETAGESA